MNSFIQLEKKGQITKEGEISFCGFGGWTYKSMYMYIVPLVCTSFFEDFMYIQYTVTA